jgi:hypothetical protein
MHGVGSVTCPSISRARSPSQSNNAVTNAETFSDRNERIDVLGCSVASRSSGTTPSNASMNAVAAYSDPDRSGETYVRQFGKAHLTASNQAPIPASPVWISCPPPTRQTTTAHEL